MQRVMNWGVGATPADLASNAISMRRPSSGFFVPASRSITGIKGTGLVGSDGRRVLLGKRQGNDDGVRVLSAVEGALFGRLQ